MDLFGSWVGGERSRTVDVEGVEVDQLLGLRALVPLPHVEHQVLGLTRRHANLFSRPGLESSGG